MRAELHLTERDYGLLHAHLFPGDRDEHALIALTGVRRRAGRIDLLARELHPLFEDEFIPGEYGYRQLAPGALARLGNRAADAGLALVTCHSHPGATTRNSLSADDRAGHRRAFPHLLDIVGAPVAGVALGTESVAGEVWLPDAEPIELDALQVVGHRLRVLTPAPPVGGVGAHKRYDRQVRLFGDEGQRILRNLRVGVVGLGGGGSLLVEQLAHLGVGAITGIDYDRVETHNLSRIVGATAADARGQIKKATVAARHSRAIDPSVEFTAIDGDIADSWVAEHLLDCDFFFLATDTITSRLIANAVTHAHFIPMIQIGAKVDLLKHGEIGKVYVAVRPVLPGSGCLHCAGLINPEALRDEANTEEERAAQNYLGRAEVIDPSVITLNAIASSTAANTMLMWATGLAESEMFKHRLYDGQTGSWLELQPAEDPNCLWCGRSERSRFARGDRASLPLHRGGPPIEHPARGRFAAGIRGLFSRLSSR